MRPLLVGELNPYGADPAMALYPLPEHASGGKLARILGLSRGEYLRRFDRCNLCYGKWSMRQARNNARIAVEGRPPEQPLVLLGRKVCSGFEVPYMPFTRNGRFFVLPHPSGRNLAWNRPAAMGRARELLAEFLRPAELHGTLEGENLQGEWLGQPRERK